MTLAPFLPTVRCCITAALFAIASVNPALSVEVVIPLTIRSEFLTFGMTKKLNARDDTTVMLYNSDCRNFPLDHPQFIRQKEFIRFFSHGTGPRRRRSFRHMSYAD